MAVNSLTFLPAVVLPNKKDDEDILSPSFSLSLDLNTLFKMFILPLPNSIYKNLLFLYRSLIYFMLKNATKVARQLKITYNKHNPSINIQTLK